MSKCKDCICEKDCDFPERKNGNGCTGIITTKNFCDPAPTCSEQCDLWHTCLKVICQKYGVSTCSEQASADVRKEIEKRCVFCSSFAEIGICSAYKKEVSPLDKCDSFRLDRRPSIAVVKLIKQLTAKDERIADLEKDNKRLREQIGKANTIIESCRNYADNYSGGDTIQIIDLCDTWLEQALESEAK